jgi:hypothetical protein
LAISGFGRTDPDLFGLGGKEIIAAFRHAIVTVYFHKGGNKFIMYFVFTSDKEAKEIFGTDEDNRIIFSRLKNPSKHEIVDPSEFFTAINIKKALNSEEGLNDETMISFSRGFSKKDLKKIKIVDQDFVLKKMKNIIKKDPKVHKDNEKEVLSDDEA